ncbi:hypothetical protein [Desulfosporosinus burensis]
MYLLSQSIVLLYYVLEMNSSVLLKFHFSKKIEKGTGFMQKLHRVNPDAWQEVKENWREALALSASSRSKGKLLQHDLFGKINSYLRRIY